MSFSIRSTGSACPTGALTNHQISRLVDTSDEWITTRTGIKSRHICQGETLTSLAAAAGRQALERGNTAASELDLILCATLQGDSITPSLACQVAGELGATCPAMDINAACSGFIYALDVADGYFARGRAGKVLVIAAEAMSRLVDWRDRSTCVLFGDGAGAVLLTPGEDLLAIRLSAHSDRSGALHIPAGRGNFPGSGQEQPAGEYLHMNGQEVFRFAVTSFCRDVDAVLKEASLTGSQVDYVLPHQANLRIIDAAKSRLCIPADRYRTNIDHFGNTSSASIPLLLNELNQQGELSPGKILVLSAFGAGFTTGACALRWSAPRQVAVPTDRCKAAAD